MRHLLLVFLLLGLLIGTGCSTRYSKANDLAKEGRFVEAAALFEQLARENPEDPDLAERLVRARQRAVEHTLGRARQFRLAEDATASQRYFAEGLELRKRWNVRLNGALEQTVEDEREDATKRLRAEVLPRTQRGEALAAEAVLTRHAFLLKFDELSALREELDDATAQSGAATCGKLKGNVGGAKEPFWTSLVAAYCKHFETAAPAEVALPETFAQSRVSVSVSGLGEGFEGQLAQRLEAEVRHSPWFSEKGPEEAVTQARGQTSVRQSQQPVALSAEWLEQVPYTDYVKQTLTESVPVKECEAYTENTPNGPAQRVRETTRTKTSSKEVVVPVTRTRLVPRVFAYQALKMDRTLVYAARAELNVGGQLAGAAGQEGREEETGYFHDSVFAPAKVQPLRPRFTDTEAWMAANTEALAKRFGVSLREGWRTRFCQRGAYSPEEAARCARAGESVPAEALNALAPRLGEDASHVTTLFVSKQ